MHFFRIAILASLPLCAFAKSLDTVFFQLDFVANAQYAGHLAAEEKDFYYLEFGLHVPSAELLGGPGAVDRVVDLQYAIGCTFSFDFVARRSAGAPVVVIGSMFQEYPNGWMSMKSSGISSAADLRGKRIGVGNPDSPLLRLLFNLAKIEPGDVTLVTINDSEKSRAQRIMDGEIDVAMGWINDEFAELQQISGGKASYLSMHSFGYAGYGQVIFTTEAMIKERPEVLRRFLHALADGWAYALNNPDEATDMVMAGHPEFDRDEIRSTFPAMLGLVDPEGNGQVMGIDASVVGTALKQMQASGIIADGVSANGFVDIRFFPAK